MNACSNKITRLILAFKLYFVHHEERGLYLLQWHPIFVMILSYVICLSTLLEVYAFDKMYILTFNFLVIVFG